MSPGVAKRMNCYNIYLAMLINHKKNKSVEAKTASFIKSRIPEK